MAITLGVQKVPSDKANVVSADVLLNSDEILPNPLSELVKGENIIRILAHLSLSQEEWEIGSVALSTVTSPFYSLFTYNFAMRFVKKGTAVVDAVFIGPPGPPGVPGGQGPVGQQGQQGLAGLTGPPGVDGTPGVTGFTGPVGIAVPLPYDLDLTSGIVDNFTSAFLRAGARKIDTSGYPPTANGLSRQANFVANFDTTAGTGSVRLFNVDDNEVVSGTLKGTTSPANTEVSVPLVVGPNAGELKSGKLYEAQIGITGGGPTDRVMVTSARIVFTYS